MPPNNATLVESTFSWLPPRRLFNILGVVACFSLLSFAYFGLQNYLGLDPCPLCIFQRLAMFSLGVVFLVAALHHPYAWGMRVYSILIALTAGIGAGIAARHVWIQHLPPDQVPACGPTLEYMLAKFPLTEAIRRALAGTGDCAVVEWRFLGLSIPEWTLLWFIGLGSLGTLRNWRYQATS